MILTAFSGSNKLFIHKLHVFTYDTTVTTLQ